jgi:hypothetical protein
MESHDSEEARKSFLQQSRIALQNERRKLTKHKHEVLRHDVKEASDNDSLESLKRATYQVKQ